MTDSRQRPDWSTRAFRALLSVYPGEFRDEYGRELAMVFADRYRDAASTWERGRVWLEALAGLVREAPKEHAHRIVQDVRYAARVARRSPVFTTAAVLTLALGIGANTAIFQLIEAVALRPLPIPSPHQLAEVRIVGGNDGFGVTPGSYGQLTRPLWEELSGSQKAFSGIFAWAARDLRAGTLDDMRRLNGIAVSGQFFSVLGVRPWRGQLLDHSDEAATCPSTRAVVSHRYWQREMGGREIGAGVPLRLDGQPHTVIGVTPPEFFGLAVGETFDVAVPLCRPRQLRRELFDVAVMGRLGDGWDLPRASAHLGALSAGVFEAAAPTGYGAQALERFKGFRLGAFDASSGVSRLRGQYQVSLQLLLGLTGLVLLIACANLANLMLARVASREREVAVRLAMGASRATLMRQFVAESLLLAAFGAALGVALAQVLSRGMLWSLATDQDVFTLAVGTNWRVLLFTALLAVATCVVFGVAPALRATRIEPTAAMKVGGRGVTIGGRRLAMQRAMVVVQIAVSLVLLVAALLFVRSFRQLVTLDAGIRQEGITIAYVGFPTVKLPPGELNEFQRRILADLRALPGIAGVGSTTNVPLLGSSWGHDVKVDAIESGARFTWVSPGYFETMNMPLLQGRGITLGDTRSARRVAVVNQTFVRQFVPSGNPLGRMLRTQPEPGFPATVYEIVGVIGDTKYHSLRAEVPPIVFAPDSQYPALGPWMALVIHSHLDPAIAIATVKRYFTSAHPGTVGAEFAVYQRRVRDRLIRDRLLATLAGFFGLLAAALAMIGLYGMIAFVVAHRRHEIGIRVALGARRTQVVGMVMRDAAALLVVGLALGAALSLASSATTASLLFGVTPRDPATLAAAAGLLTFVTAIAALFPARSAAMLDPLDAVRQE